MQCSAYAVHAVLSLHLKFFRGLWHLLLYSMRAVRQPQQERGCVHKALACCMEAEINSAVHVYVFRLARGLCTTKFGRTIWSMRPREVCNRTSDFASAAETRSYSAALWGSIPKPFL